MRLAFTAARKQSGRPMSHRLNIGDPPSASAIARPTMRQLLSLAWPVVLARLGIMLMGLTDAVVVGRHSATELGFHAIGWAPTTVVLGTGVGLLQGVQIMASRSIGQGRPEAAGGALRRGLGYGLALGLASAVGLALLGPLILHNVGLGPALADGGSAALVVFAWSLPTYFLATACTFFLEGIGRPKAGMIAMGFANIVNLGVNLWLVPGHSGFAVQGAVASAWATLVARSLLAAGLLAYIAALPDARALGVFAKAAPAGDAGAEQRRVGYGAGASTFIEIGAFSAMTLIAGQIGAHEAAAWAAVLNVAAIIFMGPLGLATATAVLVGRGYGAGDAAQARSAGRAGLAAAVAMMALTCVFIAPGRVLIASAYSADARLIALIAPALLLSCLFYIPDGLQVVTAQALRAAGDVWVPTACHLISYAVVMIPAGYFLAKVWGLGVNGLVWAVVAASFISAGLLLARYLRRAGGPGNGLRGGWGGWGGG